MSVGATNLVGRLLEGGESAKDFLARQMANRPRLRHGSNWVLVIADPDQKHIDDVPIVMLPNNQFNTQDAAYNLGDLVGRAVLRAGHELDQEVAQDPQGRRILRFEQEMGRYWDPIYKASRRGKTAGVVTGIAGLRMWHLTNLGPEEEDIL